MIHGIGSAPPVSRPQPRSQSSNGTAGRLAGHDITKGRKGRKRRSGRFLQKGAHIQLIHADIRALRMPSNNILMLSAKFRDAESYDIAGF